MGIILAICMSQGNTINDPESWMLCFWSSILLCQKMAQALWSLKPLRRPEWSSMILASVWPSPGLITTGESVSGEKTRRPVLLSSVSFTTINKFLKTKIDGFYPQQSDSESHQVKIYEAHSSLHYPQLQKDGSPM